MTLTEIALILGSLSASLFAGLMLALVLIMQRIWRQRTVRGYIADMQTFLPAAKGHPVIALLTFLPFLAPIPALPAYAGNMSDPAFILILIGTLLGVGPLLVTLRLNFPIYDAIMNWQPDDIPPDCQQIRQRFYVLNLTRCALAFAAALCLLVVLASA